MLEAEVITSSEEDSVLKDITKIHNESFPPGWKYPDQDDYYRDMLRQKDNIHIFLKHEKTRVGYLLAIPHNVAVDELAKDDPSIKSDPLKYYIETAGIVPEFRGQQGLKIMMKTLVSECKRKGITKLSMHARVTTGLSEIMQAMFKAVEVRRIGRWPYYNFEEPADYIEVILD